MFSISFLLASLISIFHEVSAAEFQQKVEKVQFQQVLLLKFLSSLWLGPKCKQHVMASASVGSLHTHHQPPNSPTPLHIHTLATERLPYPSTDRGEAQSQQYHSCFQIFLSPKEVVKIQLPVRHVYKAWWLFIEKASTFISLGNLAYWDQSAVIEGVFRSDWQGRRGRQEGPHKALLAPRKCF